jgi:hypothetical protein
MCVTDEGSAMRLLRHRSRQIKLTGQPPMDVRPSSGVCPFLGVGRAENTNPVRLASVTVRFNNLVLSVICPSNDEQQLLVTHTRG